MVSRYLKIILVLAILGIYIFTKKLSATYMFLYFKANWQVKAIFQPVVYVEQILVYTHFLFYQQHVKPELSLFALMQAMLAQPASPENTTTRV